MVGRDGREVTFDPISPGTPTRAVVARGNQVAAVACPSASRCTAVSFGGRILTFAPHPTVSVISTTIHAGDGVPLTATALDNGIVILTYAKA